jgi:hypothetical protein
VASKEQAEKAISNARWARAFGEDAKIKEAEWYPIKVDRVAREVVYKMEDSRFIRDFQDDILDVINKSNSRDGFQVKAMKAHLLGKPSENSHCSIAIYLDSWVVA